MGDFGERAPSFRNPELRFFDPAVGDVPMWRHPGRRLEGAGEMERTQAGLFGQCLDGQVFAGIGLDQILDPLETSAPRATGSDTDAESRLEWFRRTWAPSAEARVSTSIFPAGAGSSISA